MIRISTVYMLRLADGQRPICLSMTCPSPQKEPRSIKFEISSLCEQYSRDSLSPHQQIAPTKQNLLSCRRVTDCHCLVSKVNYLAKRGVKRVELVSSDTNLHACR